MAYDNTNKGALWNKTAKSGLGYKSGKVNVEGKEYNISIFDNDKAENPNRPDYNIVIQPVEGSENQEGNNNAGASDDISIEDLPF